jgi:pyruvate/2-oxoglutarate dehydrogenase complex dihydrolipoamide acyltransferase (E2) component
MDPPRFQLLLRSMGIIVTVTEAQVFLMDQGLKSMQLGDLISMMKSFKEHRQEIAKKATLVREQTRKRLQHQPAASPTPTPTPAAAPGPRPQLQSGVSTRKMISVRRMQTRRGTLMLQKSPRDLSASAAQEERKLTQAAFEAKKSFVPRAITQHVRDSHIYTVSVSRIQHSQPQWCPYSQAQIHLRIQSSTSQQSGSVLVRS